MHAKVEAITKQPKPDTEDKPKELDNIRTNIKRLGDSVSSHYEYVLALGIKIDNLKLKFGTMF